MKKKLLACLLFLFPFVAFSGHAHAETIKVVFDTAYAPFEFKDSDQTYKGIDVEILDKVAEINGWDLDKSFPGFDAAVNAVQAGQADAIMAEMTKTTEREKVGVKNGTAAQRFLDKNKDKYGYKIKTFDTGDLMYNSLSAGAVDAVMDDQPVIQYAIQKGQDLAINMDGEAVGGFAFGVKKGGKHEKLITEFNKALAKMKADGTLDEIIKKMDR